MHIDIRINDHSWSKNIASRITNALQLFEEYYQLNPKFSIDILLTNDKEIASLNAEYRDKKTSTDVLSWPSQTLKRNLGEEPEKPIFNEFFYDHLGDIALSYETCFADAHGEDFNNHVTHLIFHGTLHLLGYDHILDEDAKIMEAHEIALLNKMNIANPYIKKDFK